jgi:hypothetical protein
MKINRRDLLIAGAGVAGGMLLPKGFRRSDAMAGFTVNDRYTLVSRYNPQVQKLDPFSALTVGNGNFAFTADATGLQTFPEVYQKDFPLCTTAQWAWHTNPVPTDIDIKNLRYKNYDVHGRNVGYATDATGQQPLFNYLRQNPHRLHLGRIGLVAKTNGGAVAGPSDVTNIVQVLNLWSGSISSTFAMLNTAVSVGVCCHPSQDLIAISIRSPLLSSGQLSLRIVFPYASTEMDMADWDLPDKHQTTCVIQHCRADFSRSVDQDHYSVAVGWDDGKIKQISAHEFALFSTSDLLNCTVRFSQDEKIDPMPSVESVFRDSNDHWQNFWTSGGAIDLTNSTDERANELQRRIVLSQYNTALHCAGTMPPQETGLLMNSWYGKSHLEMHWWHGVHFAAWGRLPLFEKSLDYYHRILPIAKATAVRQGYDGVRWPKMVGPAGNDSPSPVGPLLIWQQPHPIYYAALCYRAHPDQSTLNKWSEIVFQTAKFMASYAFLDKDRYVLGPPLKTVSENTDALITLNPTFELAYWRFGLAIAQLWRQRMGLAPDPKWADVINRLSPLPTQDGLYLMQEGMTDTYTKWNWEHPALLGAYGMQPGYGIDPQIMRRSLKQIMKVWDWDRCWGWDFPMAAMTAARLGEGELAVEALMIDSVKNRYLPNGHVYQRPNLPAYLPANGGLLAAVAMMASSPNGFAQKNWMVRSEGLSMIL